MKISIFITILFALFTSISIAQETKQDSLQSDSTVSAQDTGDVEVVITTKKDQDSTIVRVKGMKIIVLNDEKGNQPRQFIIDSSEDDKEDDDDDDKKDDDKVSHWAGIRLGINGYLMNDGLPLAPQDQNLVIDYSKSLSWDLNLFEKDFRLYKNYVELVTGLGMHFANYSFESEHTTLVNSSPFTYAVDSSRTLTRNRLKSTYLTAPLMLGFATDEDEDKAFRIAFGGQVSWRINTKLKQKYEMNGQTSKQKFKSDFDMNPFLFHAVASVGYGPMNIYANYGLNPVFKSNKSFGELTPFDVGVQLMF